MGVKVTAFRENNFSKPVETDMYLQNHSYNDFGKNDKIWEV